MAEFVKVDEYTPCRFRTDLLVVLGETIIRTSEIKRIRKSNKLFFPVEFDVIKYMRGEEETHISGYEVLFKNGDDYVLIDEKGYKKIMNNLEEKQMKQFIPIQMYMSYTRTDENSNVIEEFRYNAHQKRVLNIDKIWGMDFDNVGYYEYENAKDDGQDFGVKIFYSEDKALFTDVNSAKKVLKAMGISEDEFFTDD